MELNTVIHGDCLEAMKGIPDGSVDMILCDLPYQVTACGWDTIIPFEPLWAQYERVIKPNGAIILTASQPFTSALVVSNPRLFRYALVWDKVNRYTGALNANRMPMKRHEDVLVFYKRLPTYNKQLREGESYVTRRSRGHGEHTRFGNEWVPRVTVNNGGRNPCSILPFEGDVKAEMGLHPTQKPVALFEYLIRTYTNEGETVLDSCAGSATTAIAAMRTGRNFICIEREEKYVQVGRERIARERSVPTLLPAHANLAP